MFSLSSIFGGIFSSTNTADEASSPLTDEQEIESDGAAKGTGSVEGLESTDAVEHAGKIGVYCSILSLSCVMWSGAIDNSGVLLSYP